MTDNAVARVEPETLVLFDRQDDAQIVARIRGSALKECVYHYKQGGQDIYGLGVDGIEECKRELAKLGEVIREDDVKIEREDVEYAYFKAYASRWAVSVTRPEMKLDTSVDGKRQAKFITLRNGQQMPNEFWYEQGTSKAMRNAVANLIPEFIKAKIIEAYKASARTVEMTPEQNEARGEELHNAMRDKDERDGLVAQVRELWRSAGMTVAGVKATLRSAGLSEALVHDKADWSTVSLAAITDLRDAMRKAASQ